MSRSRPLEFELPDDVAGRVSQGDRTHTHSGRDASSQHDSMAQDLFGLDAPETEHDPAFQDTGPSAFANNQPSDLPQGYFVKAAAPTLPVSEFLPIMAPMLPTGRPPHDGPQAKHVLVVDDDVAARLYMRARLMLRGYLQLFEAASGEQAMQYLLTQRFDAVLLDVDMVGQNGYEVCRAIRSHVSSMRGKQPRIYMITGRSSTLDKMRAKMAGADAFLSKPPHPGELAELLAQL